MSIGGPRARHEQRRRGVASVPSIVARGKGHQQLLLRWMQESSEDKQQHQGQLLGNSTNFIFIQFGGKRAYPNING